MTSVAVMGLSAVLSASAAPPTPRPEGPRPSGPSVPTVAAAPPTGRSMVVAGTVLTGLSVASYGAMAAGLAIGRNSEDRLRSLVDREDIDRRRETMRRGRSANILAIVGGVTAAALMGSGVTLITVGRRRAKPSSMALTFNRAGAGLGWSLRF